MKVKRPAFQFYPGDWLRETSLRLCSVGARGLWIDMMCLMHQADPYGHLVINGKGLSENPLARIEGVTVEEVRGYLSELESAGVFSRDENGVIFSRRMVRDEIVRENRAKGGELGGDHGSKGGRPKQETPSTKNNGDEGVIEGVIEGVFSKPINNPPSSSSSSSSSKPKKERHLSAEVIPDNLNTQEFLEAWSNWKTYRVEIKHKLTPSTANALLRKFGEWGQARAIAAINYTIEMGWQGIQEPKPSDKPKEPTYQCDSDRIFAEEMRKHGVMP